MNYKGLILAIIGVIFIIISFFYPLVGLMLATMFLIISLIIYRFMGIENQEKYEFLLVSAIVFLVSLIQNLI